MVGTRSPGSATIVSVLIALSFLLNVIWNQLKPHCSRLLELRRISFSCAHIGFFGFVVSLLKQYTAALREIVAKT